MRKALVITSIITHPVRTAPSLRVVHSVESLEKLGIEVDVLYLAMQGSAPSEMKEYWGSRLIEVGYETPALYGGLRRRLYFSFKRHLPEFSGALKHNLTIDAWEDVKATESLRKHAFQNAYDLVYIHYVFNSYCFQAFPSHVTKLLDLHDIFTNRFGIFKGTGKKNDWFSTWEKEELKGWQRADLILTVNEEERGQIESRSGIKTVFFGHASNDINPLELPESPVLLFVGNRNQSNVDGMQHFLSEVWKQIHAQYPKLRMKVAGRVCEELVEYPNVELLGVVDRLEDCYRQCSLVINPVRSGTGIAVKCIEAMSYGRPVISTEVGARGFKDIPSDALTRVQTTDDWIRAIDQFIQSRQVMENASSAACQFIRKWNAQSESNFMNAVSQIHEQYSHA